MELQIDIKIFAIVFSILFLLGMFNRIMDIFSKRGNGILKSISLSLTLIAAGITTLIFINYDDSISVSDEIKTAGYLLIFIPLIKIADRIINNKFETFKIKTPKIIHDIVLFVVYIFAFFTILKAQMGIDLTPIVTTSAVVSMVIGLALQDTLTNFIAGVMIHLEKPFNLSDWVFINNVEGKVVEINWRTTKVLTFENDFLVIPNNSIIKNEIINYNFPTPNHILVLNIGVSYEHPPNKVKQVILDIVKNSENVLRTPKTIVRLTSYDDFSINYEIRAWMNDYGKKYKIENEIFSQVWYAFKREGLKIPFPIRDVYHHEVKEKIDDKQIEELKLKLLSNVDIFACLSVADLKSLCSNISLSHYGISEYVFNQDDEGSSLFIISKGSVDVIIDKKIVANLSEGDFFGEISLLTGQKRTASIKVREDATFMEIGKADLSIYLNREPDLALKISEIFTARERDNNLGNTQLNKLLEENSSVVDLDRKNSLFSNIKDFFNIG